MRHTSVCGLLVLCVHVYLVSTGSSPHNVQRRETTSKKKEFQGIGTKMMISPTWYVSVGDTVEINCTILNDKWNNSNKMDLQLVWMGLEGRNKTVLVSQRASAGISYVLDHITHEHQGVYTCEDDGSLPDVYVHDWHHMIWVTDASPRASLDVISHNRSQFLNNETFTLSCQLPDNSTQWKMMRFNEWTGDIKECPNQVSSDGRLSCTTRSEYPWSDTLYWCESPAGERSNALNITTTAGVTVVLESPPLPVFEGEDVMLRCLQRDRTTRTMTSKFETIFYKNGRWMSPSLSYRPEGNLTLTAVTKADEGLYKCRHPVDGLSHDSWITVKARPDEDQKKSGVETSSLSPSNAPPPAL